MLYCIATNSYQNIFDRYLEEFLLWPPFWHWFVLMFSKLHFPYWAGGPIFTLMARKYKKKKIHFHFDTYYLVRFLGLFSLECKRLFMLKPFLCICYNIAYICHISLHLIQLSQRIHLLHWWEKSWKSSVSKVLSTLAKWKFIDHVIVTLVFSWSWDEMRVCITGCSRSRPAAWLCSAVMGTTRAAKYY